MKGKGDVRVAMIKIAGVLSTDKITFKEFKDFFFKEDDL